MINIHIICFIKKTLFNYARRVGDSLLSKLMRQEKKTLNYKPNIYNDKDNVDAPIQDIQVILNLKVLFEFTAKI